MDELRISQIAITSIPNIGDVTAKKLIAYCGSATQVFKEKKQALEKIPGVGGLVINALNSGKKEAFLIAESELKQAEHNNHKIYFYLDEDYPQRLFHCEDGPVILYAKGNTNFNVDRVVSIVGTRNPTDYGKSFCEQLLEDLAPYQPLIISGLAYGIDGVAHKAALKHKLSTIGVLAHGLDQLYPTQHKALSEKMLENGGLISDFKVGTKPDRENFPKRNRIVAGLSDLTMVVESSKKGGSLITAHIANNYNRDVFAVPGKLSDKQSEGCNNLIKTNKAALIESVKDIEYIMGWQAEAIAKPVQTQMFVALTPEQKVLTALLAKTGQLTIDQIALNAQFTMSHTAALLLELEFSGIIKLLPGKVYRLV